MLSIPEDALSSKAPFPALPTEEDAATSEAASESGLSIVSRSTTSTVKRMGSMMSTAPGSSHNTSVSKVAYQENIKRMFDEWLTELKLDQPGDSPEISKFLKTR